MAFHFSIISLIMIYYYQEVLQPIYVYLNIFSISLILLFLLSNFISYRIVKRYLIQPSKILLKYTSIYTLHLDRRYLLSKSFEILYQQILIIVLVFLLRDGGLSFLWITIMFALMFGIGHIPALRIYHNTFGYFIFAASVCSSFLFPYLILTFKYGFIYTYMAHLLFYTNTGILFWIVENLKLKNQLSNK